MKEPHIKCPQCGTENSRFAYECSRCGNFLRDKVANIDLFSTLSGLVDEPGDTFDRIIYSENKNFTSFFYVFGLLKFFFLSYLVSYHFLDLEIRNVLLIYGQLLLVLLVVLLIPSVIFRNRGNLRWRDVAAAFSFSMAPVAISSLLLIFLEFIIYGEFLFNRNPSPAEFKQFFGVLFIILESGFIIWTMFLFGVLTSRLTKSRLSVAILPIFLTGTIFLVTLAVVNLLSADNLGIK